MNENQLQTLLQDGLRYQKLGEWAQAEACYMEILAHESNAPNTLHYLSLVKGKQGKFQESYEYAHRAIELAPDTPHFHYTLATSLKQQAKFLDAVKSYETALSLKPDYLEALQQVGECFLSLGKFDEAVEAFKKVLAINPNLSEAYLGIGIARNQQGELGKALLALREATQLNPESIIAHIELAHAYIDLRQFNAAINAINFILEQKPNHLAALQLLSEAYHGSENHEKAIEIAKQVITLDPSTAQHHVSLGMYLETKGDLDAAEKAHLEALQITPNHIGAILGLEQIGRLPQNEDYLDKLNQIIQAGRFSSDTQAYMVHNAVSKILEKQKRYDEAFEHMKKGNDLKRQEILWSIEPTRGAFDELKNFFTPEFIEKNRGLGYDSHAPIFVISMPRSGSTLTEQILASHSQVFGAGELGIISENVSRLIDAFSFDFPYLLTKFTSDDFIDAGKKYVDSVKKLPAYKGQPFFTDKMPANFRLLGFIHLILPNAKFIHCIRHPIDTCLGCYKQMFKGNNLPYTYTLEEIGEYYSVYHDLMAHWKKIMPNQILDMHYEELVSDQEGQTRRLLDFCGLPWEEQCLSYHKTERPVMTASFAQVRSPIYKGALGRWKNYQQHLGPLMESLGPLAKEYT